MLFYAYRILTRTLTGVLTGILTGILTLTGIIWNINAGQCGHLLTLSGVIYAYVKIMGKTEVQDSPASLAR